LLTCGAVGAMVGRKAGGRRPYTPLAILPMIRDGRRFGIR